MVIYRTILFYAALIFCIRLMGKRQVGQMEPSEFVVTMLIANLAAIPLEELDTPVRNGLVPMGAVLVLERLLSWVCLKSIRLRKFLCGKPVILIENGRLLEENLRRTRINLDELGGHLREQGILNLETVQYAILETNGSLTVFPYPQYQPAPAKDAGIRVPAQALPYTVLSDGRLLSGNLKLLGRDEAWLDRELQKRNVRREEVLLLTADQFGHLTLIRRDMAR